MRKSVNCCASLIALFASSIAIAQPLYKSVNDQGEVTFSDSPVPNAVEVQEIQLQPGPSEARQQEAAERVKRMESQANELGAANAERAQQRQQAQQQAGEKKAGKTEVQPVTDDNNGYRYPNRSLYPPVIEPPVHPEVPIVPGGPMHPVPLPAIPLTTAPAR